VGISEELLDFRNALDGDYVAGIEAKKFVEKMEREHPKEFREWTRIRAVQFVASELVRIERRARARLTRRSIEEAFAKGDMEAIELFRQTWAINDENLRRPLGSMTSADLRFVGATYEADGWHAMAMSSFMRALAAKTPKGKVVSDVISEDRCKAMLREYLGRAALAEAA
jgi:hypothetical protein